MVQFGIIHPFTKFNTVEIFECIINFIPLFKIGVITHAGIKVTL